MKPSEKLQLEKYKAAMEVLSSREPLTWRDGEGQINCEAELQARIDFANQVMIDTFNDGPHK